MLSRVIQDGMEMDVRGNQCARVELNERKEKDNHYERRTTNETTDKDIELVYCFTFTDSSLTDITSRFRVYKARNTWTKERV